MVLLSKLTLPDTDVNGKPNKTPITQLTSSQCIQWLNPRRLAHGLPIYNTKDAGNKPPPVEQLRSEIIDAVQNGTYTHTKIRVYDDDADRTKQHGVRWSQSITITRKHLAATQCTPYTDLWTAAFHGRVAEVEYYVGHGLAADTVEFGYPHQTPLHYAAAGGSEAMVAYLLTQGCDVLAVDANGNSPVHVAARWGRRRILKLMLESCDAQTKSLARSVQNKVGQTPEAIAASHSHEGIAKF